MMIHEFPEERVVVEFPKEQELLDRMEALVSEYYRDMSIATVFGLLELLKYNIIVEVTYEE